MEEQRITEGAQRLVALRGRLRMQLSSEDYDLIISPLRQKLREQQTRHCRSLAEAMRVVMAVSDEKDWPLIAVAHIDELQAAMEERN